MRWALVAPLLQLGLQLWFQMWLQFGSVSVAVASDDHVGEIRVEEPWARASAGQTSVAVVYMRLFNPAEEADYLIRIETPVAKMASVHRTTRENGMLSMEHVSRLKLPSSRVERGGSPTSLEPGGLHIMLMQLGAPLEEGSSFPMTLTFEHAETIAVQVKVQPVGAMSAN